MGPNTAFSSYYSRFIRGDDWEDFVESMSRPLPVTFRLDVSTAAGVALKKRLNHFCTQVATSTTLAGKTTAAIERGVGYDEFGLRGTYVEDALGDGRTPILTTVPCITAGGGEEAVYAIDVDKAGLKRSHALRSLRALVVSEMRLGHLHRQEIVSMIPALFLNIKNHHRVLDMCAAPGSKSRQVRRRKKEEDVIVD